MDTLKPKDFSGESLGREVTLEPPNEASFTEGVGQALVSVLRKR